MGLGNSVGAFFKAVLGPYFSAEMMNSVPEGEKLLGPRPDKQALHDQLLEGEREKVLPELAPRQQ